MPSGPQRRATRAPHLSAAAVPVELALIARAAELDEQIAEIGGHLDVMDAMPPSGEAKIILAAEFRALAEEMHWWA